MLHSHVDDTRRFILGARRFGDRISLRGPCERLSEDNYVTQPDSPLGWNETSDRSRSATHIDDSLVGQ